MRLVPGNGINPRNVGRVAYQTESNGHATHSQAASVHVVSDLGFGSELYLIIALGPAHEVGFRHVVDNS
eukprot:1846933-Rhodomonas_salina.1